MLAHMKHFCRTPGIELKRRLRIVQGSEGFRVKDVIPVTSENITLSLCEATNSETLVA